MNALLQIAVTTVLAGLSAMVGTARAQEEEGPGQKALEIQRQGDVPRPAVENRFFLKAGRFEVAPVGGYVPNNPMVVRYVGGVQLAYHLREELAASATIVYSPDLGEADLKGLTSTLVQIAHGGASGIEFQQPIDKLILGAMFSARWAPIYGKINLAGATVVNFDLYGAAGLGLLVVAKEAAVYDASQENFVNLTEGTLAPKPTLSLALGTNYFFTQSLAVKLEGRSLLYVDFVPQYDPDVVPTERRVYHNFLASVGLSIFFPQMKPRFNDF